MPIRCAFIPCVVKNLIAVYVSAFSFSLLGKCPVDSPDTYRRRTGIDETSSRDTNQDDRKEPGTAKSRRARIQTANRHGF